MKDKIILTDPTGNQVEYEVMCHFKVSDNNHPNIKNVPILVLDTKKENNGNKVLGFLWEKDGMYQAMNDDAAWGETKSVIIDIIKNNMENLTLEGLKKASASVAIGNFRELAVNVTQFSTLANNAANIQNTNQIVENTPVANEMPSTQSVGDAIPQASSEAQSSDSSEQQLFVTVPDVGTPTANIAPEFTTLGVSEPTAPEATSEAPVIADIPVVPQIPAVDNPVLVQPTPSDVVEPSVIPQSEVQSVIPEIPTIEPTIEMPTIANEVTNQPSIPESPAVEIVRSSAPAVDNKIEIFEEYLKEKEELDKKYQQDLAALNDKYKNKIRNIFIEERKNINEIQNAATEHLKNAQAAEQIAVMAQEQVQKAQQEINSVPEAQLVNNQI